ncbi:MAG: cob(I)yrinic acid a,c-diamide adenosyltransferase [Sulfolobaceae archaeon]
MFTKKGDDGTTSIRDKRVSKDSPIVNFLGELDEASAFIGYAIVKSEWQDIAEDLMKVQEDLFKIGQDILGKSNKISENDIKWLEERIIKYRKESGPVKLFVLPGGSEISVILHIARTVVRRVEREFVKLKKDIKDNINIINNNILIYLNRLSSLLFIMAIVANKRKGIQERIFDINKYF